jgi:hypothetical protein
MSIRKVKKTTAILILFKAPECGHSNGVFEKQQCLHNQKLRTVVGQKYHPEWYFLMRPAQTIHKNLIELLYYDQLADVCILYDLPLFYSVCLIYFLGAATAFNIFGTDNAEELLTCGFQYPSLLIFILHFVARIFGLK